MPPSAPAPTRPATPSERALVSSPMRSVSTLGPVPGVVAAVVDVVVVGTVVLVVGVVGTGVVGAGVVGTGVVGVGVGSVGFGVGVVGSGVGSVGVGSVGGTTIVTVFDTMRWLVQTSALSVTS